MLLTTNPLTSILTATGPLEDALSMFPVVDELADVASTIWPAQLTVSMHFVIGKVPCIHLPVQISVASHALHFVLFKLTIII